MTDTDKARVRTMLSPLLEDGDELVDVDLGEEIRTLDDEDDDYPGHYWGTGREYDDEDGLDGDDLFDNW